MRRSLLAGSFAVLIVLTGVAACSDDGADDRADGGGDQPSEGESEGGVYVQLLDVIPDTADNRSQVFLADWRTAAEVADTPQPDDPDEVVDHVIEVQDDTELGFNPGLDWYVDADEQEQFEEQLGFHFGQIDTSVQAGHPPEQATALDGRFDVDRIDEATGSDPDWSDLRETVDYGDAEYLSWDDEPDLIGEPSPRDQLGRGGNLYVSADTLFWAFSAAVVEEMLDAAAGETESLADDDDYRLAAQVAESHEAFTFYLTDDPQSDSGPPGDPALVPYDLLGLGGFALDGDLFGLVVFVHEDESDAEENAERFEQVIEEGSSGVTRAPWDDAIDVEQIDVEGRATVAVLELELGPKYLFDAWYRRESLYASE
jgi:hypothetical protein